MPTAASVLGAASHRVGQTSAHALAAANTAPKITKSPSTRRATARNGMESSGAGKRLNATSANAADRLQETAITMNRGRLKAPVIAQSAEGVNGFGPSHCRNALATYSLPTSLR